MIYYLLKKRVMKPDSTKHNPDPSYLKEVLEKSLDPQTGKPYSQRKAAKIIGISERVMRYYFAEIDQEGYRPAPYPVQFALECLSKNN
ncbi:hypothetical protein [Acinetobacter genomosp. 15BJ]|uniref:Uncharacterized protein n=1 Tax=Acinetobacter genomosp. 15BJ TaxID=106651 RepID=A0ABT8UZA1_9GAMM|nr:hypothetical protein [Acinetobacter genomosp. 15BJ]MDO3658372.1 hypothetical protein [Acinetobacter genomosp. 15BJ]